MKSKEIQAAEAGLEADNIDYEAIGPRVYRLRRKKQLTQENLAESIAITPQHVSAIENGKTKVSLPTLINIARVLECSLDYLVYDSIPYLVERYDLDAKNILEPCTEIEREYLLKTMVLQKELLQQGYRLKKK